MSIAQTWWLFDLQPAQQIRMDLVAGAGLLVFGRR